MMQHRDRLIALALLGAMLLVTYLVGLHWWWTAPMLELQGQIERAGLQEQKLRMQASEREKLEKKIAKVRVFEQNNPGFLPEPTTELAIAELTQRLERAIPQSDTGSGAQDCVILSKSPITSPSDEQFQRAQLQVRLQCGMEDLATALYSLEGGRPQLFLENLSIQNRGSGSASDDSKPSLLDVSFELYGYLRKENTSRKGKGRD